MSEQKQNLAEPVDERDVARAAKAEALKKRYQRSVPPQKMRGPGPKGAAGRGGRGGKPKATKETIKRLLRYLEEDKSKLVFVFLCVILATVANLAGSYMLRPIINGLDDSFRLYRTAEESARAAIAADAVSALIQRLLLMGSIYLAGVFFSYLQQRIMVTIAQKALQKLRGDLFAKLQRLPVRFFDTNSHGELMSRFTNDVDTVGEMLTNTVVQIFSAVITLIGSLVLMVYTSIWLTLVTLLMLPLMMKAGGTIAKRSSRYFAAQQATLGAVNGYIEEMVSGQKVVKVFCHEDACIEEFDILNEDLHETQIKAQFFGGLMGPVMGNMSQISYSLVVCVAGILSIARGFDIGGITIFANYSRQFSRPINELSMQMTTIFSALAGAERVFGIMDQEPEQEDAPEAVALGEIAGRVELSHVTFGYNPDKTILKDISLVAEPGQKIAFVGSTGAGKTTITNLLTRFYEIAEGSITIDGVALDKIKKDSLREHIAMVLQDTHLFTGTVRENIRYGRLDATDEEVIAAAKTASAHSFIMRLEHGYDTMLEGDGVNLSQGQRQLLNIARAAISKAPILVLDEATSSVDTRTEKHIEHGMDRLMKNRTTFVIAHRLSTVRNADCIMVLEQGEIIEQGSHAELLAKRGRYYSLYTGAAELD